MKDNGRQLKSMEYAAFDPGSGYKALKAKCCKTISCSTFCLSRCTKSVLYNIWCLNLSCCGTVTCRNNDIKDKSATEFSAALLL